MNITNRIENIIIAIIASVIAITLTVSIMEMTSIRTLKKEISRQEVRIDKQNDVITELAKIEKYKIENRFDKLKAKEGQIILQLDNKLDVMNLDSIKPFQPNPGKPKQTFFEKLKFW